MIVQTKNGIMLHGEIAKDPASYSLITYGWVFALAM